MLELRVGKTNCDYHCIQDALNAVPYNEKALITIEEGVYEEKLFSDKHDLTLSGCGEVVITWSDGAREMLSDGMKRGTFRSYTAFFSGERLRMENLTIVNNAGPGREVGQAVALYLDVDFAYLEGVTLKSDQDTLFLAPLPDKEREKNGFYGPRVFSPRKLDTAIFHSCNIEGGVDFIFGGADALFDKCTITSINPGFVAAPSGRKENIGFVFNECRFLSTGLDDESVYLMRPWREEGKCTFISSSFSGHISKKGFSPWPGRDNESEKAFFGLYDCPYLVAPENAVLLNDLETNAMLSSFHDHEKAII